MVIEIEKHNIVSYIVFVFTVLVVGLTLVSLFFPALLVPLTTDYESTIDPFEPGAWALPALVTNIAIFYFGIMYYAKKIPNKVLNAIQFILNFEISPRIAAIAIIIILGGYIAFTIQDLSQSESEEWGDFNRIKVVLESFPFDEGGSESLQYLFVKNFLLVSSIEIFQNVKVIPFIGSISLLLLTYFFTAKFANKRFAGLVAMVILLQSYTFLRYDTTATYSNFWTLFYLLSLYVIYNRWYQSSISLILSIFSKPLSAMFLPMTLFFTYRANIPRRKKINILISYGILVSVIVLAVSLFDVGIKPDFEKASSDLGLLFGFTTWAFMLRLDGLVLLFLLPLTVGLFMISRKGVREADSILVLIAGILLSAPILDTLSGFNIQPYRYMPLIVFFAIGVGTLLSKKNYSTGLKNV